MKLLKTISLFLFIILITTLVSCKKENQLDDGISNDHSIEQVNGLTRSATGNTIVGEKLKNPYTVSNMHVAYLTILQKGVNALINVRPTHYYVKFKPCNEEQYEILSNDSTLHLYNYPLDVKIIQYGNSYHDPTLPSETPTYQYACVKLNYIFNCNIPYETITTLYLPEQDEQLINNPANEVAIDALLTQAFAQAGNAEDMVEATRGKYTPAGKIQVFDTRLQKLIGLEGVKVRARRWFITYTGYPDYNGNYQVNGRFKHPCNYSLIMQRRYFVVKEQLYKTGYVIDGPKQSSDWNLDLNDGYNRFAAHVFRGAYYYFYKNIDGLQRPIRQDLLKIIYKASEKYTAPGINIVPFHVINIGRWESDYEYDSDEVFSSTIHETAHSSHVKKMNTPLQYAQVTHILQESWAVAVEWWLTKLEYKARGIANYGDWNYGLEVQYPNQYAYQYWSKSSNAKYTSLFINLIDNYNEYNQIFIKKPTGSVNDQVSGYTMSYIEKNIIKHSYGISSLSVRLKSFKLAGTTDAQIDLLLSYY